MSTVWYMGIADSRALVSYHHRCFLDSVGTSKADKHLQLVQIVPEILPQIDVFQYSPLNFKQYSHFPFWTTSTMDLAWQFCAKIEFDQLKFYPAPLSIQFQWSPSVLDRESRYSPGHRQVLDKIHAAFVQSGKWT